MAEIILVSFNARYEHTSLGARCIFANLGQLLDNARIMEFTLDSSPEAVLEDVLKEKPRIIGMGVYIWNAEICLKFARELKALRSEIILVCGGPEISHETEKQPLCELADYVISGEGENAFRELCLAVLAGSGNARPENIKQCFTDGVLTGVKGRILYAAPVEPEKTDMPYDLYTEDDLEKASRWKPSTQDLWLKWGIMYPKGHEHNAYYAMYSLYQQAQQLGLEIEWQQVFLKDYDPGNITGSAFGMGDFVVTQNVNGIVVLGPQPATDAFDKEAEFKRYTLNILNNMSLKVGWVPYEKVKSPAACTRAIMDLM